MANEIVGVTIPDLPNAGALTGSEPFETVQDGISVKTTVDAIKDFVGAVTGITSTDGSIGIDLTDPSAPDLSIGYRSYVALLTQTGTSAPTATVLKNDTGLTWVYSYDDEGIYVLTPSVAPNADKTTVIGAYASGSGFIRNMSWRLGVVNIATVDSNNVAVNGVLSNSTIEIRIYP